MNVGESDQNLFEKRLYFLIGFFSVSGFYLGLIILLSSGLGSFSVFYSIPFRLFFCGLLAIALYRSFLEKSILNYNILILYFFFWFFYFFKVLFYANSTLEATKVIWPEYIFYSVSYCIIPFFCFSQSSFHRNIEEILNGFLFSGFLLGVFSFYYYKEALTSNIGRVSLLVGENQDLSVINPLILSYSGILTVTLCLFKLFFFEKKHKLNIGYLIVTIILGLIMFYLGASRGSVVALVLSLPLFLTKLSSKKRLYLIVAILIGIPLIYWGSVLTGSSIFERSLNLANDINSNSSSAVRVSLWSDALDVFANNLFFGGGIELKNRYGIGSAIYPHNLIIEILMATGLIGALFIFPIIFKGVFTVFQNSNNSRAFVFSSILFLQGFAQYFFSGSLYTAMMFFMPLAMILSFSKANNVGEI